MIQVHHLSNSRAQRIVWLLEELSIPYEVVVYVRDPHTMTAPATLKSIHPLGKSPTIRDGELVLAESGAILEYIANKDGGARFLAQSGTREWIQERYWLHYAEGSLMSLLVLWFNLLRLGEPAKAQAERVRAQIDGHFAYVESHIAAAGHFAGPAFGIADIQMSYPIELGAARKLLGETHGALLRWLKEMQARLAYRAAVSRGGGYQYLIAN